MDLRDKLVPVRKDDTGMGTHSLLFLFFVKTFPSLPSTHILENGKTAPKHLTRVKFRHSQSPRTDSDLELLKW